MDRNGPRPRAAQRRNCTVQRRTDLETAPPRSPPPPLSPPPKSSARKCPRFFDVESGSSRSRGSIWSCLALRL